MKVLVTGVSGFLGYHVANELLRSGHEVAALLRGALPLMFQGNDKISRLPLVEDQAATREAVLEYAPDAICHFAAISSGAACEQDPSSAWSFNAEFTGFLVSLARESGIWCCFSSTDLVFEGKVAPVGGFSEVEATCPFSIYGKTKEKAEQHVGEYQQGLILRSALLYGPPAGERGGMLGWILDGIKGEGPVNLFQDEWRTPIYVGDAALAIRALLESEETGLLHMGGPERLSRYEFGERVCEVLGIGTTALAPVLREELDLIPVRAEDVSLDSSKIQEVTGVTFKAVRPGLSDFLKVS